MVRIRGVPLDFFKSKIASFRAIAIQFINQQITVESNLHRPINDVHPRRLTWNLRIHLWKRKIILQTIILRFKIKTFGGCMFSLGVKFSFQSFGDDFLVKQLSAASCSFRQNLRPNISDISKPWDQGILQKI